MLSALPTAVKAEFLVLLMLEALAMFEVQTVTWSENRLPCSPLA